MTKMKMLVSISVALALLLALMPTMALAAEEPIGGSFTTGDAVPTVTAVGIYETDHTTPVTSMDPTSEYAVKVTVEDANGLDDLNTVKVTIFYDADGDDLSSTVPTSGDPQDGAILTWTNVEPDPNTWEIDAGASTEWSIGDTPCVEPTLTEGSGDFWFHFKPGKVATEALDWDAYAVADDGGLTLGTRYDSTGYDMNWYGEITVNTLSVNWGSVIAGMDFAEGDPSEEAGISVTYIANGDYDEKVAASASWTGTPSGTATLNEAGTPGANEFSLIADDTGTLPVGVVVLVTATTTGYITIDDTGVQTIEDGDTVTTNSLWLKLGTPFAGAQYDGSIYYQIAEGS